jgi:beta-lactamase regulating signal transducer with metallopeptidase domain
MNAIIDWIGQDVIITLGWTLIHSIWQIGILAIVLAFVINRLNIKEATTRYALNMGAMFAVPVMAIATFFIVYNGIPKQAVVTTTPFTTSDGSIVGSFDNVTSLIADQGVMEMFRNYLTPNEFNLQLLVGLWICGIIFFSIRFAGGLIAVRQLRTSAVGDCPAEWKQRVAKMSESMGVSRLVRLAESARVTVPMTAGWIKPIILLPVGMLANMPVAHIEMIVLHELAHIRRHDYLLNLMQSVLEIVFFYHPAIWWMSESVRKEREHCCDDKVVRLKGDPLTYAKALHAAAAAVRTPGSGPIQLVPKTGLAVTGSDGELLERIHRILNREMKNTIYSTRFAASAVLVLGLSVLLMFTPLRKVGNDGAESATTIDEYGDGISALNGATGIVANTFQRSTNQIQALGDSIPPKNREVMIVRENGEVSELYIDGKLIPRRDYSKYKEEIDRANARIPAAPTAPQPPRTSFAMPGVTPPMPAMPAITPLPPMTPMPPMTPFPMSADSAKWAKFAQQMEKMAEELSKSMENFDEADFERKMEAYEREMEKWAEEYERNMDKYSADYERKMDKWSEEYERNIEKYSAELERNMDKQFNSKEWKDWEKSMEAWGEEFGKKMESQFNSKEWKDYERSMEAWGEAFGANFEKQMEEFGRSMEGFGAQMEKFGEKMEAFGERMEAMKVEVTRELVRDGLIRNADQKYKLKLTKDGMYLDDKKQTNATAEKYRKIVRKYNEGDFSIKGLEFELELNDN